MMADRLQGWAQGLVGWIEASGLPPFLAADILRLLLRIRFPGIALALPRLLGFRKGATAQGR